MSLQINNFILTSTSSKTKLGIISWTCGNHSLINLNVVWTNVQRVRDYFNNATILPAHSLQCRWYSCVLYSWMLHIHKLFNPPGYVASLWWYLHKPVNCGHLFIDPLGGMLNVKECVIYGVYLNKLTQLVMTYFRDTWWQQNRSSISLVLGIHTNTLVHPE